MATPISFFPLIKDKNSLSSYIWIDRHTTPDEGGGRSPRHCTRATAIIFFLIRNELKLFVLWQRCFLCTFFKYSWHTLWFLFEGVFLHKYFTRFTVFLKIWDFSMTCQITMFMQLSWFVLVFEERYSIMVIGNPSILVLSEIHG